MQHYRLTIAYDGSRYCGWQTQKGQVSIEDTLKATFIYVFKQPLTLWGASRTDAGVHALGQVVSLKTPLNLDADALKRAWNNALPPDIMICSADKTELLFNPYHHVKKKIYRYSLFTTRPTPFMQKYGWFVSRNLDIIKLEQCLTIFIGRHDFRSFMMAQDKRINSIRTIFSVTLHKSNEFEGFCMTFEGNAFLRHMIRRIVGAAVSVAIDNTRQCSELIESLAQKDPRQHYMTAPAKGLLLYKICYAKDS